MVRPDDITLRRVINEKATVKEIRDAVAWFATAEGQQWLSEEMDRDAGLIDEGRIETEAPSDADDLLRNVFRSLRRKRLVRIASIAAAVLVPCVLAGGIWLNLNRRLGGILSDPVASKSVIASGTTPERILFQDGTSVELQPGSSIAFPEHFGLGVRRVRLDGEAEFEVMSNPRRPFVVDLCGGSSVKVTGTRFRVDARASAPTVEVELYDGHVTFSDGHRDFSLRPSEVLSYDKTSRLAQIETAEMSRNRKDAIYFRDTPCSQVLKLISAKYGVQFTVGDNRVYDCTYTFETQPGEPLEDILFDMQSISPILITRTGEHTYQITMKR